MDPVEELFQVQVDHPLIPVFKIARCLGDRRVTAPLGAKSMATRMERRLVVRNHHLRDSLAYDSVDHIGDAKTPEPASRLGDPYATDLPRAVGTGEQLAAQTTENFLQMLAHLADRLAVRARRPVVGGHLPERLSQVVPSSHFFHRHRRQRSSPRDLRQRHRARRSLGPTRGRSGDGPLRAVGCLGEQLKLSCLFTGRDRLPSPWTQQAHGWDRLSTALRYSSTLRLLSSHRCLVLGFLDNYRGHPALYGGREISPGKNAELRTNPGACTHNLRRISGFTVGCRLTHKLYAYPALRACSVWPCT